MTVSLEAIRRARGLIAGVAIRTPLVRLAPESGESAEIWLKLESLQPIGSFKIRGAAAAIRDIEPENLRRGVLTASAGNMAQGVAWVAREAGVPCTVIVPEGAARTKLDAIERLGGKVIAAPFERWWRTFRDRSFPGVEGLFVHAFDDDRVIAGNGTIGLEILEDLPDVDAVIVPWGGGGLACGIASAIRALKPACRVYGAEVATGAPLAAALAAGAPREVDYRASFVDGLGSRETMPAMWERAKGLLAGSFVSSLAETAAAVRRLALRARVVAEGAGAAAVAAAASGRADSGARKIVAIVSGGNIDAARLATILQGGVPD